MFSILFITLNLAHVAAHLFTLVAINARQARQLEVIS